MHDQPFNGVADRGTLGLGVVDDADSHFIICFAVQAAVHIDVTVSGTGFNDRHGGLPQHCLNQTSTAAGDQHVQIASQVHYVGGSFTGSVLHQLNDVLGQSGSFHSVPHDFCQCGVGVDRLLAAAENDHVSGFQAEGGSIYSDIGAGFKDNADDTQRHTGFEDLQAVGADRAAVYRTNGIFGGDQLTGSVCHAGNAGRSQPQTVLQRFCHVVLYGSLQVFGVGGEDFLLSCQQGIGNGSEGVVFDLRCGSGNGGFHSFCLDTKGFSVIHGYAPF